jgi:hypothetical protein
VHGRNPGANIGTLRESVKWLLGGRRLDDTLEWLMLFQQFHYEAPGSSRIGAGVAPAFTEEVAK